LEVTTHSKWRVSSGSIKNGIESTNADEIPNSFTLQGNEKQTFPMVAAIFIWFLFEN